MTLFRGTVLDTPDDPFAGGALRSEQDAGILVRDGVIAARGPFAAVHADAPDDAIVDVRDGLLLPGFVDTHVHYPQVRMIGALGMPLLDWLDRAALPEEARLADLAYAQAVAAEFVRGLVRAGTTSALVFGSHFAPAVDALFAEADRAGLRVTSGLVLGDRYLREDLYTTPQRAYEQGHELADRWHGHGRLRYAVTPRFALSCTDSLLDSARALHEDVAGSWFTTHLSENVAEIATVCELFGAGYLDAYDKHGLVGPSSVFAHNVHPTDDELALLAERGSSVAHCPTSNSALGSGLFPLRRHVKAGARVALGSDVGAGTGLSLFKEGLQAYFMQQLLGADGLPLTSAHLLHLATAAGAAALGMRDQLGDLSVGKRFDALWLRPAQGSVLAGAIAHAAGPDDALAKAFALGTDADVAATWVDGRNLPR